MAQERLVQLAEERLVGVPEDSRVRMWELAERADGMFMPNSGPRPIVPHVLSRPSIALSLMGGYPHEYKLETVGEDGKETGTEIVDTPEVFAQLVRFGVNAQAGDRRILAGLRFPTGVLYFLLRTDRGLVIQPYQRAREGENPWGKDKRETAEFPAVLRTDELVPLVEIFSDPKVTSR